MEKLADFFKLFQKGGEVANVDAWKSGQITITTLSVFLLAAIKLLSDFGVSIPMDATQASAVGGGILAVVNIGLSIVTSKYQGLPSIGRDRTQDGDEPRNS